MTSARELRIATLIVAPLLAAIALMSRHTERALDDAAPVLVVLWLVMVTALVVRTTAESRRPGRSASVDVPWQHVDVLTATGASVIWTSTVALVAAVPTGWASLSVVGMLGLATVYLAAIWTALVAGGDAPWRRATITRTVLPERSVEGDAIREQVRLSGIKIPAGMRLFATGQALLHGVTTRYVVGPEGSLADLELGSDLGIARRGEHRAPPLTLWLGDVLGLTRTPAVQHGEASFSVRPRPAVVRGARRLLGPGGDDARTRPAIHQPTEGTFRIRSYVPGDDARRIHWVRSLQTNRLVVRLPDEVPLAEPEVRVVLDAELAGTEQLTCRSPHQLLDALVQVWLGVARALTETGARVTLVAVADDRGTLTTLERPMIARSPHEALRLGERAVWQASIPLVSMLARHPAKQVVVTSRPRKLGTSPAVAWVVVPEVAWTSTEQPLPPRSPITLPFPSGSADNRLGRRRRERDRIEQMWYDRTIFSQGMCWTDWTTFSGDYLARPDRGHVALEQIP